MSDNIEVVAAILGMLQKDVNKLKDNADKMSNSETIRKGQVDTLQKNAEKVDQSLAKLTDLLSETKTELQKEMKDEYVNNDRFEPVKLIAYGSAGTVLLIVLGAILSQILVPSANNSSIIQELRPYGVESQSK